MTHDRRKGVIEQAQIVYIDDAHAWRVVPADETGTSYSATNPLPVTSVEAVPKSTFIEFQTTTSVPTNTETTVLSFTVSGADIYLSAVGGEGEAFAEWFIYINNTLKIRARTGLTDLAIEIPMYEFKMVSGDIIDVKVKHYESSTCDFSSNVRYFKI